MNRSLRIAIAEDEPLMRNYLQETLTLLGHQVVAASLPGGYYSPRVADTAREAGLQVLFTSEPTTAVPTFFRK